MTDDQEQTTEASGPNRKKALIAGGIAIAVVLLVFGIILPQLVDWDVVFDTLRDVDKFQLAIIVALGLFRYWPAGWIYALVLPGLSVVKGTRAWVATTAVASTLPGFDLVLRLAMYSSWGFPIERATSGMFLSGMVEMSTKLTLAIVAIGLWALFVLDLGLLAVAAIAAAVVIAVGFLIALILRSEDTARRAGHVIQRAAHWVLTKFHRQAPENLVDRVLDVRLEAREVLGRRWPQAFVAAFVGQALGYFILLMSLRAVGVDSDVLDWTEILLVQGLAIIITSIPITPGSVGVASLVYVGFFTALAGQDFSSIITAGVILFRLVMWLLPIPIGWIITLHWQSKSGEKLFGSSAAG